MIAEAIKKVQELALAGDEIKTILHEDLTYSTRPLHRVPDELPVPTVVAVKVAEFLRANVSDVTVYA